MPRSILDADARRRALAVPDLTDPSCGPHAMQLLVRDVSEALASAWRCAARVHRASPVVSATDNYDRLHYPPDGAARAERYTRWLSERTLLRTQTSAMIPSLLRELATAPARDVLLACPGIVYRRDAIDRLHTGEPHQIDLWRVRDTPLGADDLRAMIDVVVATLLPGARARCTDALHPYTVGGLQIDVEVDGAWIEIGECGVALPAILDEAGLDARRWSGLAMGLGLDRILMLRKGIDDIRLLRSRDPRVAAQMLDLAPYRPVSSQPAVCRDLSIAVDDDATPEELGDRVRAALGESASRVESIEVVSETPCAALPRVAAERLGIAADQKNVLLRIVLRDLERTLTHVEANTLRDAIYAQLHRGTVWHWASDEPPKPSR